MPIQTKTKDSVLTWQINRPERRNALGTILAQELWEKTKQLQKNLEARQSLPDEDPAEIRVLVIKATGIKGDKDPIWIAGGDLKELALLRSPAEGRKYAETMAGVCQILYELPIPVVALIDGLVIGGGIEFALAADFRFMTRRSGFYWKQLELGLATAYGSSQRLIQLVGVSKAMNYLLRSKHLSAEEALQSGLVHEVVSDSDGLETELATFVAQIKRLPHAGVRAQKLMLHGQSIDPSRLQKELDLFETLWMNNFHRERLEEFLKKS